MPWPFSRASALAFAALVLTACDPGGRGAQTIVLPPPPTNAGEPSALASRPGNTNHVHALLAVPGGGLIVGTHRGVSTATPGKPAVPRPGISGDVLQLAAGPAGAVFLGGHNLGIQVSRDQGQTWSVAAPEVAGLDVHGLASDPRDRRQIFAYAVGRGLLASEDGGEHWAHLAGMADGSNVYLNGLTVTGDGTLLAGSPQLGVAASTDRGKTFVSVYQGSGQVYSLSAGSSTGDVVLVAGERGLFLTQDGGAHWSAGQATDLLTAVSVDAADAQTYYAGATDGAIFVSVDAGNSWKPF